MSYAVPTESEFKARFPAFAAVDDEIIASGISEASSRVDTTWLEADFRPAIFYLTAHILTLDGHGTGAEAQIAQQGMMGFQSISSGALSLTRSSSNSASPGSYKSTSYGSRFYAIMRRNTTNIIAV